MSRKPNFIWIFSNESILDALELVRLLPAGRKKSEISKKSESAKLSAEKLHNWDGSFCVVEDRGVAVSGREVTVGKEKVVFRDRSLTGLSKKVHFRVEFSRELLAKDHLIAK